MLQRNLDAEESAWMRKDNFAKKYSRTAYLVYKTKR